MKNLKARLKKYPFIVSYVRNLKRIKNKMFYKAPKMLEGEIALFKAIFSDCEVIFDVGARFDTEYLEISKGNRKKYHLFEINPKFFKKLLKKIEGNFSNEDISANNIGIADYDGYMSYYEDSESVLKNTTAVENSNAVFEKKLPVRTIESYCKDRGILKIDFLKTDIEEFDFFALLGAEELLKDISFIQFELGLGANYKNRNIVASDYFNLFGDSFEFFIVKDENHPIWATGFVNSNLIKIDDEFLQSKLSTGAYGFGYNILAVNKRHHVGNYPLSVEHFEKVKFEQFLDNLYKRDTFEFGSK
jgi:FkbM family methyltransferase